MSGILCNKSDNPGEPESVEDERRQQDPKEPIQTTDDLDRKKDENGDKNKGQEGVNTEEIENNKRKRKRGIEEKEEEEIITEKENKKIYICGVCNKKVNKGCVKCNGCEKWIHRRYLRNKPNCSALKSNEVYVSGVYICPTCADPTKKHKGPGRPVKLKNTEKKVAKKRYERLVSRISMTAKGKRKAREEGTPEKHKSIGKKYGEKSPEKK